MITKSLASQLFKLFLDRDVDQTEEATTITHSKFPLLKIKVTTPETTLTLDAYLSGQQSNFSTSVVKTKKGDLFIVLDSAAVQMYLADDMSEVFRALVSHEIGHVLSGHFDEDSDKSWVTVNKADQVFLYDRYQENPTFNNKMAYARSVFFSLMRGGVLDKEIEADMVALSFCTVESLITLHGFDLEKMDNPFTVLEKKNRIVELLRHWKETAIDRSGYTLEISAVKLD